MITDIFVRRYENRAIWLVFGESERRLLVQCIRILKEQVMPYWVNGKASDEGKPYWESLHSRMSMELGLTSLSATAYHYPTTLNGNTTYQSGLHSMDVVCETWMMKGIPEGETVDEFMKNRFSLVELGFRLRDEAIAQENDAAKNPILSQIKVHKTSQDQKRREFFASQRENKANLHKSNIDELNTRLRQASVQLNYHNGFIQFSDSAVIEDQVEKPFWYIVSDPIWRNVDLEMKTAIDKRDVGVKDAAFDALKALESTIKVISDANGWTTGQEKGAHNFIENLASKKRKLIMPWEAEQLKSIFTNVRNSMGHGAGSEPKVELSIEGTNWVIEVCMVWVKALIGKHKSSAR